MSEDLNLRSMIAAAAQQVIDRADELTALDQAIGDGDHGINMKRGCAEVLSQLDAIAPKPTGEALKALGMALVMKVGGASGPLYGSLFMGMGKALGDRGATMELLPEIVSVGVDAVAARGKSTVGEKTMLDVLAPVRDVHQRRRPKSRRSRERGGRTRRRRNCSDARDQGARRLSRRAERRSHGPRRAIEPDHRRSPFTFSGTMLVTENVSLVDRFAFARRRARHGGYGSPDGRR